MVAYGEEDRVAVMQLLAGILRRLWRLLTTTAATAMATTIVLAAAAVAAVLVRRRHACQEPFGVFPAARWGGGFYDRFLRLAARAGVARRPDWTPHELARRAAGRLPAGPVRIITDAYCAVRYGGRTLRREDRDRVQAALADLAEAVRRRSTPAAG
jgi:hypothetical protein